MSTRVTIFVVGSFVAASAVKVDRLPHAGESLAARSFALEPGGKGFNLAVACRRLGASVHGVLPVGDDILSGLAEPALLRARLPTEMLHRSTGPTGAGIGFIDAAGENCLAVYPGANGRLSAEAIAAKSAQITAADITLAQFETGDAPIRAAFEIAHAAGKPTLLNPSPYRALDRDLLALTSILVLNATEMKALRADLIGDDASGIHEMDHAAIASCAASIMALGPQTIVVTIGAKGALLCRRGEAPVHQPAFPIDAIDTLGAGDGFAAGLAIGLAAGWLWPEILRQASACGALVASRWGVFDAFPTPQELEIFLSCS